MSKNDITGDEIRTKPASDKFRDNFDKINWGKPDPNILKQIDEDWGYTPEDEKQCDSKDSQL